MVDAKIKMEWINDCQTIMFVEYGVGYTLQDYYDMLVEVLKMIEGNPAKVIYINYYPHGSRVPEGDGVPALGRMTKQFNIDAMIVYHDNNIETEMYHRALAKSFGFEEGKDLWFVCSKEEALEVAERVDKQLNASH